MKWTDEEIEILKQHYDKASTQELSIMLPNRAINQIRDKAHCLKIKLTKILWSDFMAKILVTGAAGYIGSVLVPLLLDKGYHVKVLDLGLFGLQGLDRVKDLIELEVGDIRRATVDDVHGCDAIINLAAFSNDPIADKWPEANMSINRDGVAALAAVAKAYGVPRFIQASSASVYDGLPENPLVTTEEEEVKPERGYALSKYESERVLFRAGLQCPIVVRKGTVYGWSPRMRYDLIVNTMLMSALTTNQITCFCGGVQYRPLISINDVAKMYVRLLEADSDKVSGEIFNVSFGNHQVLEIAFEIQKTLRNHAQLDIDVVVNNDPRVDRSYQIYDKKLFRRIGFEATESIGMVVRSMYDRICCKCMNQDFDNPLYYNIKWIDTALKIANTIPTTTKMCDIFH